MMQIPATPADLTAVWLTTALRQRDDAHALAVESFRLTPMVESCGFFGELVRLELIYRNTAPGAPHALAAKFSSPVPELRRRSVAAYAREVGFYQWLAPHLKMPVPICYYANIDPASGQHILLLQALDGLK